ncbi:MAG TPA: response regulator transcription factor [Candidatus Acidoferrales bacterium]|nr:response regulator transcription factor [Bryobacteraceae bacterium]HTS65284.1 response regulator transcription factor [Candidatus Acidoferrales bacterium]
MSARILLVEDEPGLSLTLVDLLTNEGYQVEAAMDGSAGLDRAAHGGFDLVVLDLMLPRMNGLEVCRELRRRGKDVAILMLTAKSQLTDRVVGLKLGADDYLTKPFEPPELLARIEALLRRTKRDKLAPLASFQFDDIAIDFERNQVTRGGAPVSLAAKELELLRYLIERRGNVVSRDELLEGVWEYQPGVSSRTIDVHVAWLRQKLEENPQSPRHIHTVRGVGYRFVP